MTSLVRLLAALLLFAATLANAQQMVRFHTTQGLIDMRLLPDAPVTTANFLAYVRGGDYTNTMIHRSAWLAMNVPFVIQGGGYRWPETGGIAAVASRGAIPDEASPTRSNLRGTVAMAKAGPNTATSQWFINMRDNAQLDTQDGGFAVFARVTATTLPLADTISMLQRVNAGAPFNELPVVNWPGGNVQRHHAVLVTEARELAATTDSDRIFNYVEAAYPQYTAPWKATTSEALGYTYRYYTGSNTYIGTKDGMVWYWIPSLDASPQQLGTVAQWLQIAADAGY